MKLMLCAEADPALGTGHVFRCLALAEAARAAGGSATLLSQGLPDGLRDHAAAAGCAVAPPEALGALAAGADALILDGPRFGAGFRAGLPMAPVVLCDAPAQYAGRAALLVDPNPEADPADFPPDIPALVGPRYWPLRQAFVDAALRAPRTRSGILIGFGGSDPAGLSAPAAQALAGAGEAVTVLQGPMRRVALPPFATAAVNLRDVAGVLLQHRLAVVAMGSLAMEALTCGCALVGVAVNAGQAPMLAALAREPQMLATLDASAMTRGEGAAALTALLQDGKGLSRRLTAAASPHDGRGAARILQAIGLLQRGEFRS